MPLLHSTWLVSIQFIDNSVAAEFFRPYWRRLTDWYSI